MAHKYGAKPTVVDGVRFASKAEAERYQYLKFLVLSGDITGLELQPRYPLVVNGIKIGTYISDFKYSLPDGRSITEDVKGVRTSVYVLKRKLVKALYGVDVQEVKA